MKTLKRRRVEIVSFEQERVIVSSNSIPCPVCGAMTEMLTLEQACARVQLTAQEVMDWLFNGLAHGAETVGGQYRVCSQSLFKAATPADFDLTGEFEK